jgi:hypothetical protein
MLPFLNDAKRALKKQGRPFSKPLRFWFEGCAISYVILYGALLFNMSCSILTDGAVDLAKCIGGGARRMSSDPDATSKVSCDVRSHRVVTAILSPGDSLSDMDVAELRKMNVPADAIYYSGPDRPSVGHQVGFGPVNVYDAHYANNRKYSTSSAFQSKVRIGRVMGRTANHFTVVLQRRSDGVAEVVELR